MTEQEWLTSNDPVAMLEFATHAVHPNKWHHKAPSDRKLRLIACACCRQVWRLLTNNGRKAVEVAEQYADGKVGIRLLRYACAEVGMCRPGSIQNAPSFLHNLAIVGQILNNADERRDWPSGSEIAKTALIRCIVGNPYRPLSLPRPERLCQRRACRQPGANYQHGQTGEWYCRPCAMKINEFQPSELVSLRPEPPVGCSWLTADVRQMAQQAYEQRDFAGLPIIADALEEAGCPQEEESPCPTCSPYAGQMCPQCGGEWLGSESCPTCQGTDKFPLGFHHERDPASGRHEGGWTNCKTCNGGGRGSVRPGMVRVVHPILDHLRSPGPHVRGCWAVDLLLGKS